MEGKRSHLLPRFHYTSGPGKEVATFCCLKGHQMPALWAFGPNLTPLRENFPIIVLGSQIGSTQIKRAGKLRGDNVRVKSI
jgi:hypothetical protein